MSHFLVIYLLIGVLLALVSFAVGGPQARAELSRGLAWCVALTIFAAVFWPYVVVKAIAGGYSS